MAHPHLLAPPGADCGIGRRYCGAADQVRIAPPQIGWSKAVEWLVRFGLDRNVARRMPFALSGSMVQRLLASLAMRPGSHVLIADEGTGRRSPF